MSDKDEKDGAAGGPTDGGDGQPEGGGGRPGESSLSGRGGMGGETAVKGFTFQQRYTVAMIPVLLADPSFKLVYPEGTGDLDLRFSHEGSERRDHIQVKDHRVTNTELRSVVENFVGVNRDMPGVYGRFTLACRELAPAIKTLAATLTRYRNADDFFDDAPQALESTRDHVRQNIANVGLDAFEEFVIEKIYFEDDLANYGKTNVAFSMFATGLQGLAAYSRVELKDLHRVYDKLLRIISDSSTKTLDREAIQRHIDDSLRERPTRKLRPPAPLPPQRDLTTFVNRDGEVNAFCKMLSEGGRPIMVVWGKEGAGKSELVFKLLERCSGLSVRNTALIWADGRFNDYVEVMNKISDGLGPEFFEYFLGLLDDEEAGPGGGLAGVSLLVGPGEQPLRDMARARMAELTEAFLPGLVEATTEEPVVIFFDYAERMNEETREWVWGELFRAVADGKLPNVKFVLCAEQEPDIKPHLITKVKKFNLKAFELPHVVDFLKRRFDVEQMEVDRERLRGWAEVIYSTTDCYPSSVLMAAIKLVDLVQQQEG